MWERGTHKSQHRAVVWERGARGKCTMRKEEKDQTEGTRPQKGYPWRRNGVWREGKSRCGSEKMANRLIGVVVDAHKNED